LGCVRGFGNDDEVEKNEIKKMGEVGTEVMSSC
jgi:hypothetical protein